MRAQLEAALRSAGAEWRAATGHHGPVSGGWRRESPWLRFSFKPKSARGETQVCQQQAHSLSQSPPRQHRNGGGKENIAAFSPRRVVSQAPSHCLSSPLHMLTSSGLVAGFDFMQIGRRTLPLRPHLCRPCASGPLEPKPGAQTWSLNLQHPWPTANAAPSSPRGESADAPPPPSSSGCQARAAATSQVPSSVPQLHSTCARAPPP